MTLNTDFCTSSIVPSLRLSKLFMLANGTFFKMRPGSAAESVTKPDDLSIPCNQHGGRELTLSNCHISMHIIAYVCAHTHTRMIKVIFFKKIKDHTC